MGRPRWILRLAYSLFRPTALSTMEATPQTAVTMPTIMMAMLMPFLTESPRFL